MFASAIKINSLGNQSVQFYTHAVLKRFTTEYYILVSASPHFHPLYKQFQVC